MQEVSGCIIRSWLHRSVTIRSLKLIGRDGYPFLRHCTHNADISALEKQIDEMVYKLYGLTPEEIATVEGKK